MSPRSFKEAAAAKSKEVAMRLHKSGCPRTRYHCTLLIQYGHWSRPASLHRNGDRRKVPNNTPGVMAEITIPRPVPACGFAARWYGKVAQGN